MQKLKFDFWFTVSLITLIGFGAIMVFSSSSVFGFDNYDNMYIFFEKHMLNLALGLIAMFIVAKIPYQKIARYIPIINGATICLLLLVLIMGHTSNGAERWIYIGSFSFQPSEIAKITVLFTVSHMISRRVKEGVLNELRIKALLSLNLAEFLGGMGGIILYVLMYVALIAGEKHLSAIGIVTVISFVLLVVGGLSKKYITMLLIFLGAGSVIGVLSQAYRLNRVFGFLNPEADANGKGYHVIQSFYALGSGHLFGLGLGESREKFTWLPYSHTDFIMAIIGEERGYILGTCLIVFLFLVLVLRGMWIAWNAPDNFGALICTGVVMMIFFQAVINMAVASGSMPVTGMPLPFISYGGSATIILLASVGLIYNVASQTDLKD